MSIFSSEQARCLEDTLANSKFEHYGITNLDTSATFPFYESWIKDGYHGSMEYLKKHLPAKKNPQTHFKAQSAILVGCNYLPHPEPISDLFESLNLALYARGKDYHHWFRNELNELAKSLQQKFEGIVFSAHTDSSPLLERDLAHQAGLGWFGKNSCLIHPKKGSLFFIGEILCSHRFKALAKTPVHDHCGTCTRCIEACPTEAIMENKTIDARKCISYLTIESREPAPPSLRPMMQDWLFGCDLCQTICPWNQKVFKEELELEVSRQPKKEQQISDLREILKASNKALNKKIAGTPLARSGAKGLKKNAIIVIANLRLAELKSDVELYQSHEDLGSLAQWCLTTLELS